MGHLPLPMPDPPQGRRGDESQPPTSPPAVSTAAVFQMEGLRLGTWNMSRWSAAKVELVHQEVDVDVLALQETHLAYLPWFRLNQLFLRVVCLCIMELL